MKQIKDQEMGSMGSAMGPQSGESRNHHQKVYLYKI